MSNREQFEQWHKSEYQGHNSYVYKHDTTAYIDDFVEMSWMGYQAAWQHQQAKIDALESLVKHRYSEGYEAASIELVGKIQELHSKLDDLLNHCTIDECETCATIICPHKEPFHFHHDGCPACAEHESIQKDTK
jgi:hypothetical protein